MEKGEKVNKRGIMIEDLGEIAEVAGKGGMP